jgi:hypothetical protein
MEGTAGPSTSLRSGRDDKGEGGAFIGRLVSGWKETADPSTPLRSGRDDKGEGGAFIGRLVSGWKEQQVPPLRFATVGITKGRAVSFIVRLVSGLRGTAGPSTSLRFATVGMTIHLGNGTLRSQANLSSRPERSGVERSAVHSTLPKSTKDPDSLLRDVHGENNRCAHIGKSSNPTSR